MSTVQDLYTGAHSWIASLRSGAKVPFTIERFARAARANLRRATPKQVMDGCGLRPAAANQSLERAIKRLSDGGPLRSKDRLTFNFFASSFVWNPAFDDQQLLDEFTAALVSAQLLLQSEVVSFSSVKTFLTLFAVSQMHLSSVILPHGVVSLYADFDSSKRVLWVRAQITIEDQGKPIYVPLCVFLTSLSGELHCDERLTHDPETWSHPIEVVGGLKLAPLS